MWDMRLVPHDPSVTDGSLISKMAACAQGFFSVLLSVPENDLCKSLIYCIMQKHFVRYAMFPFLCLHKVCMTMSSCYIGSYFALTCIAIAYEREFAFSFAPANDLCRNNSAIIESQLIVHNDLPPP